ncbi:MAG TPA: ATP-binding protein [Spirochaetota bacterium]|nr:ATP-binding protein [Spirochaetota bacterium]HOS31724.1 ATP-binding protein [Spirochaetota bacterium]HOS54570.1 ATP-binding protein [Spirochaetota bacterium]HPK61280.1 ATP-binding protein [Spirochaetota bacterium]HQF77212.1 ATP-binding protein [Spirochaetota bacterium]
MINSSFLSSIRKKLDKIDGNTLKELVLELIEENETIKTVFNSMSEGVLVLDKEKKIIFVNKIFSKILGFNQTDALGNPFENILKNAPIVDAINSAILNEDKILSDELKIDSNIAAFISLSLHPLVADGKIIGNIVIITDISQSKENEKRLRQAESLAALTTISAGIAHEIKNPLGAMSIHIQLLDREVNECQNGVSEEIKYSVDALKEETERLSEIVNKFLFTVRPLKAELMLVNLQNYLDKFIEFIKPELKDKNIRLEKNYKNLPDVWLDEKYFRMALLNLVQNSIAALKNTRKPVIEIDSYMDQNYVVIEIIDNGDGIPDEIQNKVFDPYFTTKSYGTGLGLTIFYKIIKEHNGEVKFSSKKGETVFSIKLPAPFIEQGLLEYDKTGGKNDG